MELLCCKIKTVIWLDINLLDQGHDIKSSDLKMLVGMYNTSFQKYAIPIQTTCLIIIMESLQYSVGRLLILQNGITLLHSNTFMSFNLLVRKI